MAKKRKRRPAKEMTTSARQALENELAMLEAQSLHLQAGANGLQYIAQGHSSEAMNIVVDLMRDPRSSRKLRLACAQEIMVRAEGKPGAQPNKKRDPREMSDEELERRALTIMEIRKKLGLQLPERTETTNETDGSES